LLTALFWILRKFLNWRHLKFPLSDVIDKVISFLRSFLLFLEKILCFTIRSRWGIRISKIIFLTGIMIFCVDNFDFRFSCSWLGTTCEISHIWILKLSNSEKANISIQFYCVIIVKILLNNWCIELSHKIDKLWIIISTIVNFKHETQ
jgi:hypothetical protein